MPFAIADDDARLHYETTGSGPAAIVFVHETAADLRSWEAQVRWFSRYYRCITFNARGFAPSDKPVAGSTYEQYWRDIGHVMDTAGVAQASLVGHSMGAYSALHFGLNHPERTLGLVLAGVGSGSGDIAAFRAENQLVLDQVREKGMASMVDLLKFAPNRVQLHNKDVRSWQDFTQHLGEHDAAGKADLLQYFHGTRPSLYDLEARLRASSIPTLVVVGDEDTPCLDTSLFLKRTMSASGLWICPRTGHALHLEEPARFNDEVQCFLHAVQQGAWGARDARSLGSHLFVHEPAPDADSTAPA